MFRSLVSKYRLISSPILLLMLFAACVWLIYIYIHPKYFTLTSDTALYADVARNIYLGKGFIANTIQPLHMSDIPFITQGKWPSLYPLLQPLIIAAFFKFFGVKEFAVALSSGFFYVLSAVIIYLLAVKLFNRPVAILATFWYILTPHFLEYSIMGTSEMLFTFIILALVLCLIRDNYFWAGILSSLATFTRFQGYLLTIPVFIVLLSLAKPKLKKALIFIFSFILTKLIFDIFILKSAPPNQIFTNSQIWANLAIGAFIEPYQISRSLYPLGLNDVLVNLSSFPPKLIFNFSLFLKQLFTANPTPVIILFLLFLLKKNISERERLIKIFTLVSLLIFPLFHFITVFDFRYLHPLLPLLIIFASSICYQVVKYFDKTQITKHSYIYWAFILIPLFSFPGLATHTLFGLSRNRSPSTLQILGETIKKNLPVSAVVVSDDFASIAWYSGNKTVLLPVSTQELQKINDQILSLDAVVLTDYPGKPKIENEWKELITDPRDFGSFAFFSKEFFTAETNFYKIPFTVVIYRKKVQK